MARWSGCSRETLFCSPRRVRGKVVNQTESNGTQLRVAEAFVEDMGRGFARLDAEDLKRLGAAPGDVLQITGRRATVARAAQAPSSHCGQGLLLIDGTTRGNAQIGVGGWGTGRKG